MSKRRKKKSVPRKAPRKVYVEYKLPPEFEPEYEFVSSQKRVPETAPAAPSASEHRVFQPQRTPPAHRDPILNFFLQ